jgi:SAM-dependent methyltransferase
VLDVACGTGRHVAWLASAGYRVAGAEASEAMLKRATATLGDDSISLHAWSMDEPIPPALADEAPFDSLLCLGNSFPHLITDQQVTAAAANFQRLLRPGGLLVVGLKALAIHDVIAGHALRDAVRQSSGVSVTFNRWYEFRDCDGIPVAEFHLAIDGPGHPALPPNGRIENVTWLRAWWPGPLAACFAEAGFSQPTVARDLAGTPWRSPGDGEDVFLIARRYS